MLNWAQYDILNFGVKLEKRVFSGHTGRPACMPTPFHKPHKTCSCKSKVFSDMFLSIMSVFCIIANPWSLNRKGTFATAPPDEDVVSTAKRFGARFLISGCLRVDTGQFFNESSACQQLSTHI